MTRTYNTYAPEIGDVFEVTTRNSETCSTPEGVKMRVGNPYLCTGQRHDVILALDFYQGLF